MDWFISENIIDWMMVQYLDFKLRRAADESDGLVKNSGNCIGVTYENRRYE